jgi:hypothetical protein
MRCPKTAARAVVTGLAAVSVLPFVALFGATVAPSSVSDTTPRP